MEEHSFYDVYDSDRLKSGEKLEIDRNIYFRRDRLDPAEYAELTALSIEELDFMREHSAVAEQKIFDRLCEAAKEWETRAAQTLLLDEAIKYVRTPAVEHTNNQWQEGRYDRQEVSNMVYSMSYSVYEDTEYNRSTGQREVVAWHLTWDLWTNEPHRDGFHSGHKIAGQDRKRFTDTATMDKYLQGRIKAYAHLFTEESPPIPKDLASRFQVNGQLLPGYTIEGSQKEHAAPEKSEGGISVSGRQNKEKASVLDQLAASKKEVKATTAPDKSKKTHDPEL